MKRLLIFSPYLLLAVLAVAFWRSGSLPQEPALVGARLSETQARLWLFGKEHFSPPQEIEAQNLALARATVCADCSLYWETFGSSDYYGLPLTWTVYTEGRTAGYTFVPAMAFKTTGRPATYEPQMVIYVGTRGGTVLRIDADNNLYEHSPAGWEQKSDPERVRVLKAEAVQLAQEAKS